MENQESIRKVENSEIFKTFEKIAPYLEDILRGNLLLDLVLYCAEQFLESSIKNCEGRM